ncbi:lantibiotic dehydratase [Salinispora arenicola]|uniref:lantibiotic dehydratase n=1 Tax=Salinispora arenicola TaxID=168697 RepID=UPI0003707FA9|nr:lantibiotic dehydratase [Salinispora arenicola]NIL41662.1 lantibiotic dehydratase [Salinispora arenicola]
MDNTSVPLGASWRLWSQFALRGPGFPASGVLRLAPAGLAEAADKFGADAVLSGADWTAFEELYGEAAVGTAHELQRVAALPAFQTAVAWQNRPLLSTGIVPFLAWTPSAAGRTSMPRQREELVAHYWQRFCVKNDTIGFFGPVGWGHWDMSASGISVTPGIGLVESSEVYFSSWAVDAVAKLVNADPELRPWIAPRRVPFVRVDHGSVTVPGRRPQLLSSELLDVLARCDGVRPAREVGSAEQLEELVRRRILVWRLEVPADTRPEVWMRHWLTSVDAAGGRAAELLEVLTRGRSRITAAVGPDELKAALSDLESQFVTLTEETAVREKNAKTAPCRSLVYSDARRSARVRLGADLRDALAPLELLLTAGRWLTSTIAERVMARAREVFDGPTDLASFWFACMPVLHGEAGGIAAQVQEEFWRRWRSVLPPLTGSRVQVSTSRIAAAVREAFAAVDGGWTAARYLSPDVLVSDEGELVLGELHVATNTLGASLFVNQHPDPESLLAQTARDHPEPRLLPLLPKEHRARLSARIRQTLVRPEDYYVALVDQTADPARPRTVRSADVMVRAHDERLVAVLPDGAEFGVVDVFSHVLTTLVMDLFRLVPEADHTPRVTIDRMVVARESWRFPAAAMPFVEEKQEARRFVRARRWRRQAELPRFVFVVSPAEPRPFFVDFDAPVYVNILAKAVRRMSRQGDPEARLVITEMLPTPEQTWLVDDQGERYTAELRFVAVDDS